MASDASAAAERPSRRRGRFAWVDGTLLAVCLGSLLVAASAALIQVRFGAFAMTLGEAWYAVVDPDVVASPEAWRALLFGPDLPVLGAELPDLDRRTLIVWTIRVPRVVVAALVGINLGVAGAIFQAITRNELASPFVLGVSQGAGFAILLTLVLVPALSIFLPLMAALGGAAAFLCVYAVAWKGGTSPVRLVLAGVVVGMVFWSLQRALFFLVQDIGVVQNALAWITGSLTGVKWDQFRLAVLPTLFVAAVGVLGARQLDVLLLGEDTASSLGMSVERVRFGLATVAILGASAAIAVAGVVSFVGLIVPHIVRTLVGPDHRRLVVGCLFVGPALMVAADVGARLGLAVLVGSDGQMPVGIVTGLVGGVYFLYLMRTREGIAEL